MDRLSSPGKSLLMSDRTRPCCGDRRTCAYFPRPFPSTTSSSGVGAGFPSGFASGSGGNIMCDLGLAGFCQAGDACGQGEARVQGRTFWAPSLLTWFAYPVEQTPSGAEGVGLFVLSCPDALQSVYTLCHQSLAGLAAYWNQPMEQMGSSDH